MDRGVHVQRSMNPHFVIVGGKLAKDPAQMHLTEHDHVVNTFPSDRADQSLRVPVLPRRARGNGLVADAHGAESARDGCAVNRVLVADQIAWGFIPREGFSYLLRDPFCRWVSCDVDP